MSILQHVQKLSQEIGSRPIGSAANRAATAYIESVFVHAGLQVEQLPFDCPDWHAESQLESGGKLIPSAPNMWSVGCDVTAPTLAVCTVHELKQADLRGKIGILYGDLSKGPLFPKGYTFYNPERDQEIVRLLEEKQPAALITVNLNPPSIIPLLEDWLLAIPSVTVRADAGLALVRNAGQTVHLKIEAVRQPSASAHVVAHKTGSRPEKMVFCAHYDTKSTTPGAMDNAGGVAALLTIAEMFAAKNLDISLEFIAFSDEEYMGNDDRVYMAHYGDQLETILAAINMDGIGQALGTNTICIMAHAPEFQTRVEKIVEKYPGVMWVEAWPQSNHSHFSWRGVPAIALTSIGVGNLLHEPTDTIDWMSEEKLAEVVALVTDIAESIQHEALAFTRLAEMQAA